MRECGAGEERDRGEERWLKERNNLKSCLVFLYDFISPHLPGQETNTDGIFVNTHLSLPKLSSN